MKQKRKNVPGTAARRTPGRLRSPVFFLWIISYLLVLILPLLLSFWIFGSSRGIIQKNTEAINQLSFQQTEAAVDRVVTDVFGSGRRILMRREVDSLSYAAVPLNSFKRQNIASLQAALKEYSVFNPYIADIFVVFDQLQLAASTEGLMSVEYLLSTLQSQYEVSPALFAQWQSGGSRQEIRLLPSESGGVAHIAAVVTSTGSSGRPDSICVIILRGEVFTSLLQMSDDDKGTQDIQHLWITDRQQALLCPAQTWELASTMSPKQAGEAWVHDEYVITQTNLEQADWQLISAIPAAQYASELNHVQFVYLILLGVCLITGIAFSVLMARFNYRPVKALSSLAEKQDFQRDQRNEFEYITHSFFGLIARNERYQKEIDAQKASLRQANLVRMLRGTIYSPQGFRAACADYGINFSGKAFLVIAFQIMDFRGADVSTEFEDANAQSAVFLEQLQAVLPLQFLADYDGHLCEHKYNCYYIASPKAGTIVNTQALETICTEVIDALAAETGNRAQCYISAVYQNDVNPGAGIHEAYQEVEWAFSQMENLSIHKPVLSQDGLTALIQEKQEKAPHGQVFSGYARRRQFTQFLQSGNLQEAKKLLPALMREGLAGMKPGFSYLRMHCVFLVDYVISAMEPKQQASCSEAVAGLCSQILMAETAEALTELMEQGVSMLAKAFQQEGEENGKTGLHSEIQQYINLHFTDPNLSVSSLAEHFKLSQSYLLRVFKKGTGSGILDYIHQRRVDESKVLLRSSKKTVAEIAEEIGYANTLALTRAFKRLEGITPTNYRNLSG